MCIVAKKININIMHGEAMPTNNDKNYGLPSKTEHT